MPIVNCDVKLVGRFHCDTPESAGPAGRARNQMGTLYDAGKAHCAVTLRHGTSGTFLERQDINFYKGHVPDAPPLLGKEQSKIFLDAYRAATSLRVRGVAMAAALCAGAVVGAVAGCFAVGLIAAVHAINASLFFGVTASHMAVAAAAGASVAGVIKMVLDWSAYAQASSQFSDLYDLSQYGETAHESLQLIPKTHAQAMRRAADKALESDCWAIRHAGLELLAVMRESDSVHIRSA